MEFTAFDKQSLVLKSKAKVIGAFAGKRGGKTEVGAIKSLMLHESREGYKPNGIDPLLGVICAPTTEMLNRLSWKKFEAYAKPFLKPVTKHPRVAQWYNSKEGDESLIYGISADKPERIEGIKAFWVWIDEIFQVKEQFFLECLARLSDLDGTLICTGSLGIQHVNPKQHWVYKYFKKEIDQYTECFEWGTEDNPHYPRHQLERFKSLLDRQTYRAMYQIAWDVTPSNAVYSDFNDDNVIEGLGYNPELPVVISVDWGWTHPMAVGVFQYDKKNDVVYQIDELIKSKVKLSKLLQWIKSRPYPIDKYICDIAGDQEREQSGISNIRWFRDRGIHFKRKSSSILVGISVVRSYILSASGRRRFFISSNCELSQDGLKRYAYPEKDGKILNEKPVKEDDDAVDMIRYYFIYEHPPKDNNNVPSYSTWR